MAQILNFCSELWEPFLQSQFVNVNGVYISEVTKGQDRLNELATLIYHCDTLKNLFGFINFQDGEMKIVTINSYIPKHIKRTRTHFYCT